MLRALVLHVGQSWHSWRPSSVRAPACSRREGDSQGMRSVESSPAKSIDSDMSIHRHATQGWPLDTHSPRQHRVAGEGEGGGEGSGGPATGHLDATSGVSATLLPQALHPPHATGFHLCDLFHASLQENAQHQARHQAQHAAQYEGSVADAQDVQEHGEDSETRSLFSGSRVALPSCSLESFLASTHSWTCQSADADEQAAVRQDRASPVRSSQHCHLDVPYPMAYPMVPFASVMQKTLLQVACAASVCPSRALWRGVVRAVCRVLGCACCGRSWRSFPCLRGVASGRGMG